MKTFCDFVSKISTIVVVVESSHQAFSLRFITSIMDNPYEAPQWLSIFNYYFKFCATICERVIFPWNKLNDSSCISK